MTSLRHTPFETPLATLHLWTTPRGLCALSMGAAPVRPVALRGDDALAGDVPDDVMQPLQAYFRGDFEALSHIALDMQGTPFQQRVWATLREIQPGTTCTYGELAADLSTSPRAVGRANALNPVALVVPCHRVVGADGSLTGYAYGCERKAWLLAHETPRCAHAPRPAHCP